MTRGAVPIQFLTPELRFALKHWREMNQLLESRKPQYDEVRKYVAQVYQRVGVDARPRIMYTAEVISSAASDTAKISWTERGVENEWGIYGSLRKPRGRSVLGWAGIYFDGGKRGIPRIVLNVWPPRKRREGCRLIQEECRGRWHGLLSVPREELADWPGWEDDESPSVVYHAEPLRSGSSLPDTARHIAKVARRFFKIALPHLSKLATGR